MKTIYSGIQPTGCITLGNYIGAINNWLEIQNNQEYKTIYSIVDLHSLTVRQVPCELRNRTLSFAAQYLACGIDPKKSIIYLQSSVKQHTELSWVLDCFTYVGEMNRMTQFKDKSRKHEDNINMGLMNYPVLMASDILLYQTDLVPIGIDQKQHLEIARDVAIRFNNLFGDTFIVPDAYIPKLGAKVMSLQDPTSKMSKSDENPNATISLLDTNDEIVRKLKRAVTDSETEIKFDLVKKPGVSNLLTIYSVCSNKSIEKTLENFDQKSYKSLKEETAEAVISVLEPIRKEYEKILNDKSYLMSILRDGKEQAAYIAEKTMRKVRKKVGLVEL